MFALRSHSSSVRLHGSPFARMLLAWVLALALHLTLLAGWEHPPSLPQANIAVPASAPALSIALATANVEASQLAPGNASLAHAGVSVTRPTKQLQPIEKTHKSQPVNNVAKEVKANTAAKPSSTDAVRASVVATAADSSSAVSRHNPPSNTTVFAQATTDATPAKLPETPLLIPTPEALSPGLAASVAKPSGAATNNDNASLNTTAHARALLVGAACPNAQAILSTIEYPAQAWRAQLSGEVLIEFTVTPSGAIKDLTVLKRAAPALTQASLQAISRLQCLGQGKDIRVQAPFTFKLQ